MSCKSCKYVVTIGFFDGVHIGHQTLISFVKKLSELNDFESLIFTFDKVGKIDKNFIYPLHEKVRLLKSTNVDGVIVLKYDNIRMLTAKEFFYKFIVQNNISTLIIGEDFRFGKNAKGDINLLKKLAVKFDITVFVIKDVFMKIGNIEYSISSSLIRKKIIDSDFLIAEKLLGREYFISGKVVKGSGIATKLGVPTINFEVEKYVLVPHGIIVGIAKLKNSLFPAIAYFGFKPTFGGEKFSCEVHILGKFLNSVPSEIAFRPILKIREERKFGNLKELKNQIMKDVNFAKKFFKNKSYLEAKHAI